MRVGWIIDTQSKVVRATYKIWYSTSSIQHFSYQGTNWTFRDFCIHHSIEVDVKVQKNLALRPGVDFIN